MITAIEHKRVTCPYCESKDIKQYSTVPQKSVYTGKILRVDRFFKCKICTNTFKTYEKLDKSEI